MTLMYVLPVGTFPLRLCIRRGWQVYTYLVTYPNVQFAKQATIMELHASSQKCVLISHTQECAGIR